MAGCTDDAACNYDAAATEDDGSCDFCSCARAADYTLTVTQLRGNCWFDDLPLLRGHAGCDGPHERGVWQRPSELACEHP